MIDTTLKAVRWNEVHRCGPAPGRRPEPEGVRKPRAKVRRGSESDLKSCGRASPGTGPSGDEPPAETTEKRCVEKITVTEGEPREAL